MSLPLLPPAAAGRPLRVALTLTGCLLGVTIHSAAGPPLSYHGFAQVAAGPNLRTTFLVYNPGPDWCRVEFTFRNDAGGSLALPFPPGNASGVGIDIFPGAEEELQTSFSEDLRIGSAILEANCEVGAQVLFEIFNGGVLVTQAAVESPGPLQTADLFVVRKPGTETGIAVANLASSNTRVSLTLSQGGNAFGQPVSFDLPPSGHSARFLNELFEGRQLPEEMTGILHVRASGPIALTTLQQTGLVLGTLPVIESRNSANQEGN